MIRLVISTTLFLVLTLCSLKTHAAFITLDFDSLEGTGTNFGSYESYGNSLVMEGFEFSTGAVFGGFISYLPGFPLYSGSIALIPNQSDATTTLRRVDNSAFDMVSISLAFSDLFQPGSSQITFSGLKSDTSVVNQTFTIDAVMKSFNFNSSFDDLVSLTWSHSQSEANNHRFSNVTVDNRVSAIPEPASASILVLMFLCWIVSTRRKSAAFYRKWHSNI